MSFFKKMFGKKDEPSQQHGGNDSGYGQVIVRFHQLLGSKIEWKDLPDTEFAMWLPGENDLRATDSAVVKEWTKIYGITKDYWSYITADLLKAIGLLDAQTFRIALPADINSFALHTPDNFYMVLSLSEEKGIRFHFTPDTALEYRMNFLKAFYEYCVAWEGLIKKNNGEQDQELGFNQWWLLTLQTVGVTENTSPVLGLGKILK